MDKKPNFKALDASFRGKWNNSEYPSFYRAVYDMYHVKKIRIRVVARMIGSANTSVRSAAKKMGIYEDRILFKIGSNINIEKLHGLETLKKMDRSTKQAYNRNNLINDCIHYTIKTWHEQGIPCRIMAENLGVKIENIRDCLRRMKLIDNAKKDNLPGETIVKRYTPLNTCTGCGEKIRSFTNQCNWCYGKNIDSIK